MIAGLTFTFVSALEHSLWTNFSLMPDWLRLDKYSPDGYSKDVLWLTAILYFILNGILAPLTEELYFRGFLLPRMNKLGKAAPLMSSVLFSLYHLFTPWENISRIVAFLPIAYVVSHKKNIRIGMTVHCATNLIGCVSMIISLV